VVFAPLCITHGKDEIFVQNWVGTPAGKRPLGGLKCRTKGLKGIIDKYFLCVWARFNWFITEGFYQYDTGFYFFKGEFFIGSANKAYNKNLSALSQNCQDNFMYAS
jgi:hypothetical protein